MLHTQLPGSHAIAGLWLPQDEEAVSVQKPYGKRRSRREKTVVQRYDPVLGGDRPLRVKRGRAAALEGSEEVCNNGFNSTGVDSWELFKKDFCSQVTNYVCRVGLETFRICAICGLYLRGRKKCAIEGSYLSGGVLAII